MYNSIIHSAGSAVAASTWPAAIFLAAITLVTVVALVRAPRSDASNIFAAFAAAFGFRGVGKPGKDNDHSGGRGPSSTKASWQPIEQEETE
ncbi:hypothetical protein [Nocardia sp. NPDC019395]|uniref:hypothetical protein n=1 Tax=Nocardia sp. NPDC019395 TaxID=3154686 RepID=UPI0033E2ACD2